MSPKDPPLTIQQLAHSILSGHADQTTETLRLERYPTIDGKMVEFRVLDTLNRVRGSLALETDALRLDDPVWLMERVSRVQRPDLKLIG